MIVPEPRMVVKTHIATGLEPGVANVGKVAKTGGEAPDRLVCRLVRRTEGVN